MRIRLGFIASLVLALLAVFLIATPARTDDTVKIRRVEMTPDQVQLKAGGELYYSLCASCHGHDAQGTGPAAPALTTPPADLTKIAERNHGEFPTIRVMESILGQRTVVAHGVREMPVWGDLLRITTGSPAMARLKAYALLEHIESLQSAD